MLTSAAASISCREEFGGVFSFPNSSAEKGNAAAETPTRKGKPMPRKLIVLLFLLIFCVPVIAWNRAGHMVSGVIAYKELKATNPIALQRIVKLLQESPDFPKWKAQSDEQQLSGETAEMYWFAMAARWADDVRQTSYDHPTWHYINYPVVIPNQTATISPPQPAAENIVKAFETNVEILHSNAPATEKAVALCWIFHLVGDVHQPLHTTALFTLDYPRGDRGGNAIYVRVKPDSSTINLHGLWDDLIQGSERTQSVNNRATELRATLNRRRLVELTSKEFTQWAKESYEAAVKYAYRNGTIKGGASKDDGVVLPGDYIQLTKPIAERRVVLAGYRLADTLAMIASGASSGRLSSAPSGKQSPSQPFLSGPIFGNRNSRIYHLPTCPDYEKISEKNRVPFKTETEAQQAGYRKARNCL